MAINIELSINQKIEVSVADDSDWYPSIIQDIGQEIFQITIPIKSENKLLLRNGDTVYIKCCHENAIISFTTICLGLALDNIPLYCLSKRLENIQRIQRRNNVRVNTNIDVYYSIHPKGMPAKQEFKKTTALDISAGGMRMLCNEEIKPGAVLDLSFYLPSQRAPMEIITKAKVARCFSVGGKKTTTYHLGLEFQSINRSQQDYIVKYVFNKMVKQNHHR